LDDYPNPDLAIEIDISRSKIDRPGIYAALKVPELWLFHKERFSIERLGPGGKYAPASNSRFLAVRPLDITRWILEEPSPRGLAWQERLRDWVRDDLSRRADA
jgi:Uma2 family endonuclease